MNEQISNTPRTDEVAGHAAGILNQALLARCKQIELELNDARMIQPRYQPPTQAIHMERDRLESERDAWREMARKLAASAGLLHQQCRVANHDGMLSFIQSELISVGKTLDEFDALNQTEKGKE